MKIQTISTRIFTAGEKLLPFICAHLKKLPENSVLVVTSKIVALSENRVVVAQTQTEKYKYIKLESEFALKTKYVWLTLKDKMLMANAGVDESNANGKLILLPRDSFLSAHKLRLQLKKFYKIKNLGVLITDSRVLPCRSGVVGVALGYAGFRGLFDYRGQPDIFGRLLKMSQTNIADGLAASAVVCMGEGKEQRPLALLTKTPAVFCEKINSAELQIDINDDMYFPLLPTKMRK